MGAAGHGTDPYPDPTFGEKRFKFSGFGGQGVLSLGLVIAEAAGRAGRYVSWLPSYGPEQRGGSAPARSSWAASRDRLADRRQSGRPGGMNQPAHWRSSAPP